MIYKIWDMVILTSFYGTLVGLTILIIKKILGKKISPTWGYLIWIILILKLIIPFGPPSKLSLFNNIPVAPIVTEQVENGTKGESNVGVNDNLSDNYDYNIVSQDNDTIEFNLGDFIQDIIPYIWMVMSIGILVLVIYTNILFNLKINKKVIKVNNLDNILRMCTNKVKCGYKVQLVVTDYVSTPSITGLIKPKILMPLTLIDLNDKEIEYIFLHELAHYKRKDIFINYILIVLQAIHWFNPFIWYYFKQIKESMEYATDEIVLNLLNDNEYKSYGMTLLNVISNIQLNRFNPSVMSMASGKKEVEKRLYNLKFSNLVKRKTLVFKASGLLTVCIISIFTLTSSYIKAESKNLVEDNEISKLDTKYIDVIEKVKDNSVDSNKIKTIFTGMEPVEEGQVVPRFSNKGVDYENGVLEYMIGSDSESESITMGYSDKEQTKIQGPLEYKNRNTGIFSIYYPNENKFSVNRTVQGSKRQNAILDSVSDSIVNSTIYIDYMKLVDKFNGKEHLNSYEAKELIRDFNRVLATDENSYCILLEYATGYITIEKDYYDTSINSGINLEYRLDGLTININSIVRFDNDNERVDGLQHNIEIYTNSINNMKTLIPSIETALYK